MTKRTLYSSYAHIEHYLDLLNNPTLPAGITAIDAFLMQQVAAYLPNRPTVLDMAAQPTGGASTVMWATGEDTALEVFPARLDGQPEPDFDWRRALQDIQAVQPFMDAYDPALLDANGAVFETLQQKRNSLSPLLVTLALPDDDPAAGSGLRDVLDHLPDALVFMLPVADTATSTNLRAALDVSTADSPHTVTLGRELSPFLAKSKLALVYPRADADVPMALERCAGLFEGNFDYLALLDQQTELLMEISNLQALASSRPQQPVTQSQSGGLLKRVYHAAVPFETRIAFRDLRRSLMGREKPG